MIRTLTAEKIHFAIAHKLAKGASYIDALIDYSKENNIEIETIAEIVKKYPLIKEKIRSEAISLKLIKKEESDVTQFFD
jgi:hypothetical protein